MVRRLGMTFTRHIAVMFTLTLPGVLTACPWTDASLSRKPDEVLFQHAMHAVGEKRCAVAKISLQTLVNTYPDSKYADEAKQRLQDPLIANCQEFQVPGQECGGTQRSVVSGDSPPSACN